MTTIAEILISAALVISGIFGFVGSYGLVKLKTTVQRLHAPTKATTLGIGGTLIASMIWFYVEKGHLSVHELLITLFLFLSAPITANFIAKAYMAYNMTRDELPDAGGDYGWAIYEDPPSEDPAAPVNAPD